MQISLKKYMYVDYLEVVDVHGIVRFSNLYYINLV